MVDGVLEGDYRNVQIAGAVIAFAGVLLSLGGRGLVMACFGMPHVHLRKPILTYWKALCFTAFMGEMAVLFTLGEAERVTGSGIFFNWSRWLFYTIAIGIGYVGMIAEFQQHTLYWTRWYLSGYVLLMGAFAVWNAFAPFYAQRSAMFGFQALGLLGYVVGLFWFDNRGDCTSRTISVLSVVCITIMTVGFIIGHQNQHNLSRFKEACFHVASMAFMQLVLAPLMLTFYCKFDECKSECELESKTPICSNVQGVATQ